MPGLYTGGGERLPDNICALEGQLLEAGIIESSAKGGATVREATSGVSRVAISRATPLVRRVVALLASAELESSARVQNGDFVISDLSNLADDESLQIVREQHRRGCISISVWRRGDEIFLGPITAPGSAACWDCARQRLAGSLSGDIGSIDDDPALAKAVAENVILAIRYPEVAGYGCLVAIGQSSSLHSVLPMPWCATCGGVRGSMRWAPINHSLLVPEGLRLLADPRAGAIRHLYVFEGGDNDMPHMPICASCVMAPVPLRSAGKEPALQGEGKGRTREEAVLSAIGEGVERYSASLWNAAEFTRSSFNELGDRAFDPRWLVLFDNEQYARPGFAFKPLDSDKPMLWTRGHWLDTNVEVLIPAQATYFDFTGEESPIGQTTSNGVAAGNSFEDAALRALYELTERDAFMLHWLAGLRGVRIDPDDCDEFSRSALEEARRLGAHTELYLLDLDTGYPTVVCLGFGDGNLWPGATIGLGTHADVDVAFRKAVLEHGHYGPYMRRLMREGRHQRVLAPEDVVNSLDHGLYYCHVSNAPGLDGLRQSHISVSLSDLRKRYRNEPSIAALAARLLKCGIRTAAVDVTAPDVALAGIKVVRAFGIYAQPIHFGFGYERRNNPRLNALSRGFIQALPHPIA